MDDKQIHIIAHLQKAAVHYSSTVLSRKQYIHYRFQYDRQAPTIEFVQRQFHSWERAVQAADLQSASSVKRLRCLRCGHRYSAREGMPQYCDACMHHPVSVPADRIKQSMIQALQLAHVQYGETLTAKQYRQFSTMNPTLHTPSVTTIYRHYTKWSMALEAAGLTRKQGQGE